jgi:glycosyltransferase involved in cell wall biosynthesis
MSVLRVLYSSNAFWSASGYGVQGRSLLPRLAELPEVGGRENIAMFAWYGLQGGLHNVEGFRVYPAGVDPYGNDIIGAHTRDFGANVVISLIDVWVMQQTAEKIAPAFWCVPGDTVVELLGSKNKTIEELYRERPYNLAIWGHNGDAATMGRVDDFHYVGVKPTLEIETETGRKLRTTAESGIYVSRGGQSLWIQAANIIPGDMVYCIAGNHKSLGEHNDQLGTQAHDGLAVSNRHSGNGTGLSGGHFGRRRSNQHPRPYEAPSITGKGRRAVQDTSAGGAGIQHEFGSDSLVTESNRIQVQRTRQAEGADQLSSRRHGLSHVLDIDAAVALSDSEEAVGGAGNRICADSGGAFRLGAQPAVWAARGKDLADPPRVELEEVRSVRSTGICEPVFDLTTTPHNFFANGMLIHNCPWLPIDHDPVPQRVLEALQGAHLPLTYSKWGHKLLASAGVENHYIPHGIEPTVFRVIDNVEAVQQFKQEKLRDVEHLTVMVAANKGLPDRKAFQVQLRAWAQFAKDKPKAKIYIHTEPSTRYGGIDFPALVAYLGIGDKIFFPNQYEYSKGYSAEYLAMMYNAADVFLGAAMSEGFGIPIIEAQACGTPVIVTDFSAMPELVRWGYKIAPRDMVWSPLNSWQAWPDVDGIREALEELYGQWHDQGNRWEPAQRQAAQAQIHTEYDWNSIVRDQWAPLMQRLAGELAPPTPVQPQPAQPAVHALGEQRRVTLVKVEPEAATA